MSYSVLFFRIMKTCSLKETCLWCGDLHPRLIIVMRDINWPCLQSSFASISLLMKDGTLDRIIFLARLTTTGTKESQITTPCSTTIINNFINSIQKNNYPIIHPGCGFHTVVANNFTSCHTTILNRTIKSWIEFDSMLVCELLQPCWKSCGLTLVVVQGKQLNAQQNLKQNLRKINKKLTMKETKKVLRALTLTTSTFGMLLTHHPFRERERERQT